MRRAAVALALVAASAAPAALAASTRAPAPRIGGCRVFPGSNAWNRDVSRAPVDPRSAAYVAAISAGGHGFLHPDFGSNPGYGIPYRVVDHPRRVPIHFTAYGDESDPGPYPIPRDTPVEAGSDRHVLVVDRSRCKLYELGDAHATARGWDAAVGAVFDLRSNRLRPAGWTSADAAGLPILPGLARYDEVRRGRIDHALRFTVERTQRAYVHPATHYASSSTDPALPPMGLRLRLRAGFDLSRFHGAALVVLRALKRYGMIVADNGTSWYITGATDRRWRDGDLDQLKGVPGGAFEVVRTGAIHRGGG